MVYLQDHGNGENEIVNARTYGNENTDDDDYSYELAEDSYSFASEDEEHNAVDSVNLGSELTDFRGNDSSTTEDAYRSDGLSKCDEHSFTDYDGDLDSIPKPFRISADGKINLEVKTVFETVHHFRKALRDYVVQEGFEILRKKNEKSRVTAVCAVDGCPWRVHASLTIDKVTFQIKTLRNLHTCIKSSKNKEATSTWIAKKLSEELRAEPDKSYELMQRQMISRYGIEPHRKQLYRARDKARKRNEGDHVGSFSLLPTYANMILQHNPGSIVKISYCERQENSNEPLRFKRVFFCLEASKTGFIEGCMTFIGLDGCHLKGQFGGILLSAVTIDGNGGCLPICIAVTEIECKDTWKWFLELLKEAIGNDYEGTALTFMSDKQKGLTAAVNEVFPLANHRYCCRHLYNNFKAKFPGVQLKSDFWAASLACNEYDFKIAMMDMERHNKDAHAWIFQFPVDHWARHSFNRHCKADQITNNVSESFNHWLASCRGKPIVQLLDTYRTKLMTRFSQRFQKGCTWEAKTTEDVRKKFDKLMRESRKCRNIAASRDEFQVIEGARSFMVKLQDSSCSYGYWEISGIPCKHVVSCIAYNGGNIDDYVVQYFSNDKYLLAYGSIVHHLPDLDTFVIANGINDKILPPTVRRLPGRPRKNRKEQLMSMNLESQVEKMAHYAALTASSLDTVGGDVSMHLLKTEELSRKRLDEDRGGNCNSSHPTKNGTVQSQIHERRAKRNEKVRKTRVIKKSVTDGSGEQETVSGRCSNNEAASPTGRRKGNAGDSLATRESILAIARERGNSANSSGRTVGKAVIEMGSLRGAAFRVEMNSTTIQPNFSSVLSEVASNVAGPSSTG